MNQGYPVHTGAWTNWSRGQILGATVTLTRQAASLVIAFTSTFIAFVATRVWRLLCFSLHRYYSDMGPQGTTYHQLQAILRNAAAPEDGTRLFLRMLSMKRRKTTWYAQLLFSTTCGTILLVSFTVLGGFSSSIATSDNEVLIQSAGCGYVFLGSIQKGANYAQQCFSNEDHQFDCDHFVKEMVTGTIDNNATCPFDNSVCVGEWGNISIDSGFINSHLHLGINALSEERILWRNVLHCAPLTTASFTSLDTESQPNDVLFHYGNLSTRSGSTDYMFRIPDLTPNTQALYLKRSRRNGTVIEINSDFVPIDALVRADADTILIFLSGNGVAFSEHTNDVLYNVSTTATNIPQANGYVTQQVYFPHAPASPLACANQHQFCTNEHPSRCGPLASLRDAVAGAAPLFATTYAGVVDSTATTEKAARFIYFTNGFFAVNRDVAGLDVAHLWDITMAIAQEIYLDSAYGQSSPGLEHSRENYTASEFESVCRNQRKIKSTAYTSLSIFGLVFIYLVGFLLALVSYLVEPASAWLHKRCSYGQCKHLGWTTNATLQLQRLAHEGIGQGTWSKGVETVPTAKEDEPLACWIFQIWNILC
ncbi:hypothetical protein F5Y03DRAFT_405204 [Xylaria venustula]|nr:hypothetical protein F5Y03DRAFT_405204 [Xylaria venustula]